MNSDSFRSVQVLKNGKWIGIEFHEIREGDVVRLFEPTGEAVLGLGRTTSFKALCDAYIDIEHNVYSFAMEEVE